MTLRSDTFLFLSGNNIPQRKKYLLIDIMIMFLTQSTSVRMIPVCGNAFKTEYTLTTVRTDEPMKGNFF